MKIFIALMLIIWFLVGIFFVPIADGYIEARSDSIVDTLENDSVGFAASWAEALRQANALFADRVAREILSKDALSNEYINYAVEKDSYNNLWCTCYFSDGSIIDATRIKNNSELTISIEYYEACKEIFSAFKERSEREFG